MKYYIALYCILSIPASGCCVHVIKTQNGNQVETRKLPSMQLPLIQQMAVKYGFAKFWATSDVMNEMCDQNQEFNIVTDCKLEPIMYTLLGEMFTTYMNLIHGNSTPESFTLTKSTNDLFQFNLEYLCRTYQSVDTCIQQHPCTSDLGHLAHLIYNYICGDGKPDLLTVGPCLLETDESQILRDIPQSDKCTTLYGDISSSMQVMVAMFHDADSANPSAIESYLNTLCEQWTYLNRCMLPAFTRKCGTKTTTFYQGLIKVMKDDLKRRYRDPKLQELVDCDSSLKQTTMSPSQSSQSSSGLHQYYNKLAQRSLRRYRRAVYISGSCAPWTVLWWMRYCLWDTAAKTTHGTISFTGLFSNIKENAGFIQKSLLDPLQECLNMGGNYSSMHFKKVEDCAPGNTINVQAALSNLEKIIALEEKHHGCLSDLSALIAGLGDKVNAGCGLTLPEFTNFYVFQSTQIFLGDRDQPCEKKQNVNFHHVRCLKTSLKSMFTNQIIGDHLGEACREMVPVLDATLNSLDDTMDQTHRFYRNVFKQECCAKNGVPWNKCI